MPAPPCKRKKPVNYLATVNINHSLIEVGKLKYTLAGFMKYIFITLLQEIRFIDEEVMGLQDLQWIARSRSDEECASPGYRLQTIELPT